MALTNDKKDSIIALGVTILVTLLMLLALIFTGLTYDERLAKSETATPMEEEEIFLEPELLLPQDKSVGEPDAANQDAPAPEVKGEPEPAPAEQPHTAVSGDNPNPAPQKPKQVTQEKPSAVESTTPSKSKEEEKVASSMAGKFKGNPGLAEGKFDSNAGSSESSTGITGKMSGRQFLGCPAPDVTLSHRTVVTVAIQVDAEGKVTTAKASGATDSSILKKCEQAALQAKWSAKKGATSARGTITFTIIPR